MSGDIDFEALMRQEGVERLDSGSTRPPAGREKPSSYARPGAAASPRGAPRAAARPEADEGEAERLRARVETLEAENARLAQAERALRADLKQLQERLERLDAERRGLQRKLGAAPAAPEASPAASTSLAELLEARGLEGEDEKARALTELLGARPREVLEAAALADPAPMRALLDDRLALLCDDPTCASASPATTVLAVSEARCEVCGGSDIRRAFAKFSAACAGQEVERVTFVGGSPAYRAQLETLASGDARLDLGFVRGDKKPGKKAAAHILRGADLVVIWGATILDHSTSDAFRSRAGRKMTVQVRGISSMLHEVAAKLG